MANGNSRKFKQNQIIFCIQTSFVEYSRPMVFDKDRLRKRGSLPDVYKRQSVGREFRLGGKNYGTRNLLKSFRYTCNHFE